MAAHPLPARAGAHPGPVPEREERKSLVQIRCNACGLQNDIESRALCPGTCCWSPRCELSACPAQLDARLPNSLRPSSQRPTNLPMMTTKFRMVTILMITFVTCCPMRECIGRCASPLHSHTERPPETRPSYATTRPPHPVLTVCTCACMWRTAGESPNGSRRSERAQHIPTDTVSGYHGTIIGYRYRYDSLIDATLLFSNFITDGLSELCGLRSARAGQLRSARPLLLFAPGPGWWLGVGRSGTRLRGDRAPVAVRSPSA